MDKSIDFVSCTKDDDGHNDTRSNLQKNLEKAVSINQMSYEIIANMSHEINTYLNGIMGMLDLLNETEVNPEQKEYIQIAKISAKKLHDVSRDILDLSTAGNDENAHKNISFNIWDLTEEIIRVYSILGKKKDLRIYYRISPEIPPNVTGNPNGLHQILNNLMANAIKYTHTGSVILDVKKVDFGSDNNDSKSISILFSISDTGIGISAGDLKLLFKRFSQVGDSILHRGNGTGLGLAICKQLTEIMGGSINVKSDFGKGSTFELVLPFNIS